MTWREVGWVCWIAGGGALWAAGCGPMNLGSVRTTGVAVEAVCPEPVKPQGPAKWLAEVARIEAESIPIEQDRAFEAYLASGTLEDRVRLLALTLAGPRNDDRDNRMAEILDKDPAAREEGTGDLGNLEAVLRRAFDERVRNPVPEPVIEEQPQEDLRSRLAELEREAKDEHQKVQKLHADLRARDNRVRALERQIEELKSIEQIIDRREQDKQPGGTQ